MTHGLPVRQATPILGLDDDADLWAIIPARERIYDLIPLEPDHHATPSI